MGREREREREKEEMDKVPCLTRHARLSLIASESDEIFHEIFHEHEIFHGVSQA